MLPETIDHLSANNSVPVEDLASLVQAAKGPDSMLLKLSRAANILRYYRISQLIRRGMRSAAPTGSVRSLRRLANRAIATQQTFHLRKGAQERMRSIAATRLIRASASRQTLCDDLSQGRFTLLRKTCELGTPIDWHGHQTPHPSHLWCFQLHYHEYLLDLAVGTVANTAEDSNAWQVIWQIVADWIKSNRLEQAQRDGDAWHPYCISRRLPIWAQLFALREPPEELRDRFLEIFACQAEVLSKTLEFDLGGNHLLENLRALALAGSFLDGPLSESWLDLAMRQFRKQLAFQVLPHGEHYEGSPMYHCQVLGNLLQVAVATTGVQNGLADDCRQNAAAMHSFLQSILHPDGEIPLFSDSCWGETHSVEEINALAQLVEIETAAQISRPTTVAGPYWIWRNDDDALIFDAGPVGASDLPAHAHCDLLGFEASIAGQRWFVDSGLFDYEESEMRDYCRSSAAHNVVTVDHQNCCDVWSRFRMGRRGRPTQFAHGQQGEFSWCLASHNGYRHLDVPEISRLMVMHSSGVWTCLEHATTKNVSLLVGRLHLAPEIELRQLDPFQQPIGPQQLELTSGDVQRLLTVTEGIKLGLAEGWYCDRFGQRMKTQVITYRPSEAPGGHTTFGWSLSLNAENSPSVTMDSDAPGRVEVAIPGDSERFYWQFSNDDYLFSIRSSI